MNGTTMNGDRGPISVHIIEAIAAASETDPLSLKPPLYQAIDPDALERLLSRGTAELVRFDYDGRTVTVRRDGTVTVDGTEYDPR